MKNLLIALAFSTVSCYVNSPEPIVEPCPVELQVLIMPLVDGCALSKVKVYDDSGKYYRVEGCNSGTVTLDPGRVLGWVELLGVETVGWSVYQIR